MASFFKLPALARILAPTVAPRTAVTFGAIVFIVASTSSSSLTRNPYRLSTWRASSCTTPRFSSVMLPPLLLDAAARIISTFSGGNPASSTVSAARSCLRPARAMRVYPFMLSTAFSNSGKCRPYHSLTLAPFTLMSRSISSRAPIA